MTLSVFNDREGYAVWVRQVQAYNSAAKADQDETMRKERGDVIDAEYTVVEPAKPLPKPEDAP